MEGERHLQGYLDGCQLASTQIPGSSVSNRIKHLLMLNACYFFPSTAEFYYPNTAYLYQQLQNDCRMACRILSRQLNLILKVQAPYPALCLGP